MEYKLEKWIWTDSDFEQMGWHDATVYGFRLNENLELDIDYIFQWNQPDIKGFQFTFWVAPCTLVFEKPADLSFELTQSLDDRWIEIDDIEKSVEDEKMIWTIITHQGDISFKANTYKQVVRKKPSFQLGQTIPYDEREGFSFDFTPGDKIKEELRPHVVERRRKDFESYELAKRKFLVKKDWEDLHSKRESGQIQTKDFLIQKKDLKEKIDSLVLQLKGTRYDEF